MRRGAKPGKAKVEPKLPVARKSLKSADSRVGDLEKQLAEALKREAEAQKRESEALDQQTATAEILSVISRSPTEVRPVFETILERATTLCEAQLAHLWLYEGGEQFRLGAGYGSRPDHLQWLQQGLHRFGRPFFRDSGPWRVGQVADVRDTEPYRRGEPLWTRTADHEGMRTLLGVPLVKDGRLVGSIAVYRREVRPFTDAQVELVKTFADQAVIAIENVRLFKELEARNRDLTEGLERETATGEILRVISSSPTDIQPVLDTVVKSAARLCDAYDAQIFQREGDQLLFVAHHGPMPSGPVGEYTVPLVRGTINGRSVLEGLPVHVADMQAERDEFPEGSELARRYGHRTVLSLPLMREGVAIGTISVRRAEIRPFTERQIALLQTFANQAVIAIENVRLFTELESRNRDLTTALDQRTATAEILRVISSSPTNVQPTFEAIAESATRLCGAVNGLVFRFDGELIHVAAHHNIGDVELDAILSVFPIRPGRGSVAGRAIESRRIVHVEDLAQDPEYEQTRVVQAGFRTALSVPMLRDGVPIGTINVMRMAVAPFSPSQIALLQTFADQAVIAIENVRLFKELEARNRDLHATGEILQVISRSPTDEKPVFDSIVRSTIRLCDAKFCVAYRYYGEQLHVAAHDNLTPEMLALLDARYPQPPSRETATGVSTLEGRIVHIPDASADDLPPASREFARQQGWGSMLAVPLLRDGQPVGNIAVARVERQPFTEQQIALVQTFADQAVIAIENVRLFTELRASNHNLKMALDQKTATGEVLQVISRSQTDVQPVFDAIADSAVRLFQADICGVFRVMDGQVHEVSSWSRLDPALRDLLRRSYPRALDTSTRIGQAILECRVLQITDMQDPRTPSGIGLQRLGFRSQVNVPMLRGGEAIGGLSVVRRRPGAFSDDQIDLLKIFADQAVIAIENVRLFTELQEKNQALTEAHAQISEALEQQTATSEILRVIASSPTDLQPVLDALAESASRLCRSVDCNIFLPAGDRLVLRARYGPSRGEADVVGQFVLALVRGTVAGRTVFERRTVHVIDLLAEADEFPEAHQNARRFGFRTMLSVPLIRESAALGVIQLRRTEVNPFTDRQAELLKTFADQAVIAIENVRLFTELQASNRDLTSALDTQTATSDILRVISQSQTDVQPVFDAILSSAVRLLRGYSGAVTRLVGDQITLAAATSSDDAGDASLRRIYPQSLQSETANAQAIRDRAPLNIADAQADPRLPDASHAAARARGFRSLVTVPLLGHDEAVGTISVMRRDPGGFSDDEIALLKTFADQAVIAIENARLLSELQQKNDALTQAHAQVSEALEQQTATAEILRVISSSPTDVQPVFDTLVRSAVTLCDGLFSAVLQFDGELLHHVARHNVTPEGLEELQRTYPARPTRALGSGRAILERAVVHIPDTELDPEFQHLALSRAVGFRSGLFVPMLREGTPIGVITVHRAEPGPFSDSEIELLKTFADQAVIAIENVRLFTELRASNRELTTALDQQTATSDILRVISRSQTDVQPVFDAILGSAVRLLRGYSGTLTRLVGDQIELVALTSTDDSGDAALRAAYPQPLQSEGTAAQAMRDRATLNIADAHTDPRVSEAQRAYVRVRDYRSWAVVPLLRPDEAVGTISVTRRDPGGFSDDEIALLKTFADQAVIAIENVRLFTELEEKNESLTEALERQTATSEILRVISSSPTDVQPVFDTIVRNAGAVCDAVDAAVFVRDADGMRLAAHTGPIEAHTIGTNFALSRATVAGCAMLEARPIQVDDLSTTAEFPEGRGYAEQFGYHTTLAMPLVRDGSAVGALLIRRGEVREFSDQQVGMLQTFADQAVIAIENVRLFSELQASNRDLTTALDEQTATSEILRVISQSQTDVQPVFGAILSSAIRLMGAQAGVLTLVNDDQLELAAFRGTDTSGEAAFKAAFPLSLKSEGSHAKAIRHRAPVNIANAQTDPQVTGRGRSIAHAVGYRSMVAVPMLRHDAAIGTISATRPEPGGFTDDEIALLQTFADQAVIAIENVRLFTELEGRNRDLMATSEILRVISQSPTDVQPVFDTIVRSAVRLCDGLFGTLFQFDGELIHVVAQHNVTPEGLEELHRIFPMRPTRGLQSSRAILERTVVHVPDVELDPEYQHLALSRAVGFRSALAVPLLREGAPIGVIAVTRAEPGPFSDNQVELLKTFADQAVIAVENVRLFKELQARTGELTQSVEKLTALGEVSRAVSSTLDVETVLDTIVSRATQLAGADGCAISEYDDATELFHVRATHGIDAAIVDTLRTTPLRRGEGVGGRATEMREPIQIADIAVPGAYQSHLRDVLIGAGFRAVLSVPLLREEQVMGSLSLSRKAPGEFSPEVVEVLKTFATQSALAIQNARLFREIADKSAQLEAASRHKSEFLANMSHELRTPLNAIIGFSEILAEKMFGDINEKQTEYLQDILESGRHLLSLINDILDLSKIEAGRMELEVTDFDLPSAIDNALILVRERASRRGIRLGSTIDERLGTIVGDERKVKQVLLNLLSNALKFTPEGGRIDVSAGVNNGVAEIAVADTGVGIAPEDQEAVFEEFRQVGTADKKVEGTGLGLALSRKFIELHGGRIWVQSQLGAGSTFTFTLPVRREE